MTTPKKTPAPERRKPAATPRARAPSTKPLDVHDVVAALLVEHRYAARLLDVLDRQRELILRGRVFDREAVRAVMSYMTEYPDAYHHPREDAMFVRLEKRDPHLRHRIAEIDRAHRTLASAGKRLLAAVERDDRAVDPAEVASRIHDYVSAQRDHMKIEELELFPRARQLLDADDLAEIEHDFRRVTDPIFEASVRDAYAAYPSVVRMLVEQPALRQVLDTLETIYESAATLGEVLFGGGAARSAEADEREQAPPTRRASRSR